MGIQFFGQFLIAHGEVDDVQLRDALELMDRKNTPLGDLAVELGLLDAKEVRQIHAEQRGCDLSFGDLCIEQRWLSASQLVELLRRQHEQRLPIGEALVRLGHLDTDRLGRLLDIFKVDQAKYTTGLVELPDGLANHRAVQPTISLFPRLSMRVAGMRMKIGTIRRFSVAPEFAEFRVSVPLLGVQGLDVAMISDAEFAERLAMATTGFDRADLELDPEMVADGMGEFLNVVLGNVISALSADGHPMNLGTPDYEAELSDGWIIDLAVESGHAALVLSLF